MWPFGKRDEEKNAALKEEMARNNRAGRAELLWKQGTRFMERKRYDKALDCYRDALEIEPSRLEGRLNMGTAFYLNGQPEEALPHFRYVLALEPQNTVALINLAATLGDLDGAIQSLEKLVQERPNWRDANYNLAVAYVKKERWDDATDALRRELTLNPKNDAARTLLNDVHLKPRKKGATSKEQGENQPQ